MEYIDSNIFIYPILYKGKKTNKAKKILERILKGKISVVTASLTVDEVVWKVWMETGVRDKGIKEGYRILKFPNLKIKDVTSFDIYRALNLMKKYEKLKPRDAIHLALCLNSGIYTIISDDKDFDEVEEVKRIGLD